MSLDNGINGAENIDAEGTVRENEDASLQDDSYSFDETNTNDEEYHDSDDDEVGELDFTVDADRMNEVTPENDFRP